MNTVRSLDDREIEVIAKEVFNQLREKYSLADTRSICFAAYCRIAHHSRPYDHR